MSKIKPEKQVRNGYNNALDMLQSADVWKHTVAASKIVNLRKTYAKLMGSVEDYEAELLAERGLPSDFINKAVSKAAVVEAVKAYAKPKNSYEMFQEAKYQAALRWLSKAADIRNWNYASEGIDNVITVCLYTKGLVDYGNHMQYLMQVAQYEEKGTLYTLSVTTISDEKVDTISSWQIGFNMMLNLIAKAEEICKEQGIKSPFPVFVF